MAEQMTEEQVYGLAYATIVSLQNEVAQLKAQLAKLQPPPEPDCPPEPDTPPPTTSTSDKKTFEIIAYELEHSPKRITHKWRQEMLSKIINASIADDNNITEKEYQILLKILKKK